MIQRKGVGIGLLGFFILFIGCVSLPETTQVPGSLEDLKGCYSIFPAGPWESVHKIEATIRGLGSYSVLGVTKGEPSESSLQSILLTPEGFVLFEAEFRDNDLSVRKAVASFDSPAFARGLMDDVTLLFFPPREKPTIWKKKIDGTMICQWEDPHGFRTEVKGSMDTGWRIKYKDKRGEVIKEVSQRGPFVDGLASHIELNATQSPSYQLRMTLIQTSP
jgi:hypothetical protein